MVALTANILRKELFSMLQIQRLKKAITVLCIALVGIFSSVNCFGSFGITKTVYGAHQGLKIGSGLLAKFIQTILMYFPFSVLYAVGFVADVLLFNLVEFWTGSNPVAMSEFDINGELVKNVKKGDDSLKLTYRDFGKELKITVTSQGKTQDFYAFRDKEGVLFHNVNGEMKEIEISSKQIGASTILKLSQNGKITATKVVNSEEMKSMEEVLLKNL
jgi:hypothetical protein